MNRRRPAGPPMTPETARMESAIDEAMARGDFDDLPGSGKPLHLPDRHDPDWWIKQRIEDDDVDRDALLPVVMLLRREHGRLEETLAELRDEQEVREYAEDFTSRVHADRAANPLARMLAPELDPDEAVERWRELRARAEPVAQPGPDPSDAGTEPSRHRRWWPFGRSG